MASVRDFTRERTVIDVDVHRLKELCLNGEFTELSAIAMMDANEEELEILSKNNETAKMIRDKIVALNNDEKFVAYMEAHKEALEKREKVLDEWAKDTAKMMLKKGIDVDKIMDDTCLTEEEIEALK